MSVLALAVVAALTRGQVSILGRPALGREESLRTVRATPALVRDDVGMTLTLLLTSNDWGQLLSGLGSVIAGVAALAVLLWELIRAKREREEQRNRQRREQAEGLTWWVDRDVAQEERRRARPFADAAESGHSHYSWANQDHVAVLVQNSNKGCLYEGSLQLPAHFQPYVSESEVSLEEPLLWRQIGVIPPGSTEFHVAKSYEPTPTSMARRHAHLFLNRHVEWIEFRDQADILWRRFGDGRLEEQPPRSAFTDTAHAP